MEKLQNLKAVLSLFPSFAAFYLPRHTSELRQENLKLQVVFKDYSVVPRVELTQTTMHFPNCLDCRLFWVR